MSTTYYHTIDGSILGQTTAGVRTDYMTDALGSVTGTTVSGAVGNTYRYMPFGALLAKTGTASDPLFLWVGTQGYRATQRTYSDCYVRLRHLAIQSSSWTSLDKYWPVEPGWAYAANNPPLTTDPTGALTAQPVNSSSWTMSCCGGFNSFIDWKDFPGVDGWIVQYITYNMTYFKSCPPTGTSVTISSYSYFEAWQVKAGVVISVNCFDDNFDDMWRFNTAALGPQGSQTRSAIAVFIPGTPTGIDTFQSGRQGVLEANCLPSTYDWNMWSPYLNQNASQTATQTVEYDWNCCCYCPPIGPPNPCIVKYRRTPSYSFNFDPKCGCPVKLCASE
jgi:hypothetical protein